MTAALRVPGRGDPSRSAVPAQASAHDARAGSWPVARILAWLLLTLVCVGWTWIAGKDLNWDQINYHFYSGYSAFTDRFDQDLLPASVQSYLVPYAHAPFYLLVAAQWPALAVGVALAVLHSISLWMLYEFARLMPRPPGIAGRVQSAFGLVLGVLSPIFLTQVGSSFSDIVTCAPMMIAIVLLARGHHVPVPAAGAAGVSSLPVRSVVFAGLFAGWAVGWKATNLAFALGAAMLIVVAPSAAAQRLRSLVVYGLAGGAGAVIAAGPWMWRVHREFGNPLFPLFNQIFRSPQFDPVPIALDRFVPNGLLETLLAPFRMMMPRSFVYFEIPTVDTRYAVFLLLGIGALLFAALARDGWQRRASRIAALEGTGQPGAGRLLAGSVLMFAIAWLIWSRTSGNGRYMLPLTLLVGPLVAASIWRLSASTRWATYATALLVFVQATVVLLGSQWRWNDAPWGGSWFKVELPAPLAREPALFLAIDTQTASFLVPALHPRSSYVAIESQYPLVPDAPLAARFERLRARHAKTWVVGEVLGFKSGSGPILPVESADRSLRRFGLRLEPSGCRTIRVDDRLSLVIRIEEDSGGAAGATPASAFFACPAVAAPGWSEADLGAKTRVEQALAQAERQCPTMFRPAGAPMVGSAQEWRRFYVNSDVFVTVAGERITIEGWGRPRTTLTDTVADWHEGRFPRGCPRFTGRAG